MESIVSRHIANNLMKNIDSWLDFPTKEPFINVYQKNGHNIMFRINHCHIGEYPSGGLRALVDFADYYDHLSLLAQPKRKIRFKSNYTKEKITKAVSRAIFDLEKEKFILDKRENFYTMTMTLNGDKLAEIADKYRDINPDYDTLTYDDILKWTRIFGQEGLI